MQTNGPNITWWRGCRKIRESPAEPPAGRVQAFTPRSTNAGIRRRPPPGEGEIKAAECGSTAGPAHAAHCQRQTSSTDFVKFTHMALKFTSPRTVEPPAHPLC